MQYIWEQLNHICTKTQVFFWLSGRKKRPGLYKFTLNISELLFALLHRFEFSLSVTLKLSAIVTILLTLGCSSHKTPDVIERSGGVHYYAKSNDRVHIVRKGDTLFSIAKFYRRKVTTIAKCNKLRYPYTIYPGQKLTTYCSLNNNRIKGKQSHSSQKNNKKPSNINKKRKKPRNVEQFTVKGRWRWPTIGHVVKRFQSGNQAKTGLEIGGKYRQKVFAARSGKVVYSGSGLIGYGKLIIVKHDKRFLTAYGYNAEILVKEGDKVKAGQVIAKMGRSSSNKAALFFELRRDGKPVNPLRYLPSK